MTHKSVLKKSHDKEPAIIRFGDPFEALRHGIDRVFEEFRRGSAFDVLPSIFHELRRTDVHLPRVDVAETDDEVQVSAELPGMDEKEVEVTIRDRALSIRGEKTTESEHKKRNYHVKERAYGSFQRVVTLPEGVDVDAAKASFKKGVLTIAIPKTHEAKKGTRSVAVEAG